MPVLRQRLPAGWHWRVFVNLTKHDGTYVEYIDDRCFWTKRGAQKRLEQLSARLQALGSCELHVDMFPDVA